MSLNRGCWRDISVVAVAVVVMVGVMVASTHAAPSGGGSGRRTLSERIRDLRKSPSVARLPQKEKGYVLKPRIKKLSFPKSKYDPATIVLKEEVDSQPSAVIETIYLAKPTYESKSLVVELETSKLDTSKTGISSFPKSKYDPSRLSTKKQKNAITSPVGDLKSLPKYKRDSTQGLADPTASDMKTQVTSSSSNTSSSSATTQSLVLNDFITNLEVKDDDLESSEEYEKVKDSSEAKPGVKTSIETEKFGSNDLPSKELNSVAATGVNQNLSHSNNASKHSDGKITETSMTILHGSSSQTAHKDFQHDTEIKPETLEKENNVNNQVGQELTGELLASESVVKDLGVANDFLDAGSISVSQGVDNDSDSDAASNKAESPVNTIDLARKLQGHIESSTQEKTTPKSLIEAHDTVQSALQIKDNQNTLTLKKATSTKKSEQILRLNNSVLGKELQIDSGNETTKNNPKLLVTTEPAKKGKIQKPVALLEQNTIFLEDTSYPNQIGNNTEPEQTSHDGKPLDVGNEINIDTTVDLQLLIKKTALGGKQSMAIVKTDLNGVEIVENLNVGDDARSLDSAAQTTPSIFIHEKPDVQHDLELSLLQTDSVKPKIKFDSDAMIPILEIVDDKAGIQPISSIVSGKSLHVETEELSVLPTAVKKRVGTLRPTKVETISIQANGLLTKPTLFKPQVAQAIGSSINQNTLTTQISSATESTLKPTFIKVQVDDVVPFWPAPLLADTKTGQVIDHVLKPILVETVTDHVIASSPNRNVNGIDIGQASVSSINANTSEINTSKSLSSSLSSIIVEVDTDPVTETLIEEIIVNSQTKPIADSSGNRITIDLQTDHIDNSVIDSVILETNTDQLNDSSPIQIFSEVVSDTTIQSLFKPDINELDTEQEVDFIGNGTMKKSQSHQVTDSFPRPLGGEVHTGKTVDTLFDQIVTENDNETVIGTPLSLNVVETDLDKQIHSSSNPLIFETPPDQVNDLSVDSLIVQTQASQKTESVDNKTIIELNKEKTIDSLIDSKIFESPSGLPTEPSTKFILTEAHLDSSGIEPKQTHDHTGHITEITSHAIIHELENLAEEQDFNLTKTLTTSDNADINTAPSNHEEKTEKSKAVILSDEPDQNDTVPIVSKNTVLNTFNDVSDETLREKNSIKSLSATIDDRTLEQVLAQSDGGKIGKNLDSTSANDFGILPASELTQGAESPIVPASADDIKGGIDIIESFLSNLDNMISNATSEDFNTFEAVAVRETEGEEIRSPTRQPAASVDSHSNAHTSLKTTLREKDFSHSSLISDFQSESIPMTLSKVDTVAVKTHGVLANMLNLREAGVLLENPSFRLEKMLSNDAAGDEIQSLIEKKLIVVRPISFTTPSEVSPDLLKPSVPLDATHTLVNQPNIVSPEARLLTTDSFIASLQSSDLASTATEAEVDDVIEEVGKQLTNQNTLPIIEQLAEVDHLIDIDSNTQKIYTEEQSLADNDLGPIPETLDKHTNTEIVTPVITLVPNSQADILVVDLNKNSNLAQKQDNQNSLVRNLVINGASPAEPATIRPFNEADFHRENLNYYRRLFVGSSPSSAPRTMLSEAVSHGPSLTGPIARVIPGSDSITSSLSSPVTASVPRGISTSQLLPGSPTVPQRTSSGLTRLGSSSDYQRFRSNHLAPGSVTVTAVQPSEEKFHDQNVNYYKNIIHDFGGVHRILPARKFHQGR